MRVVVLSRRLGGACIGIALAVASSARAAVVQAPLDPNAYASLGALTGYFNYQFDTGNGSTAPTLTAGYIFGPVVFTGVLDHGVAVFDFTSIDLPSTFPVQVSGSVPLALLSRGTVSIRSAISVSASGTTAVGGNGTGGVGPGAGGGSSAGIFGQTGGGGGFGGRGSRGSLPIDGAGGPTYQDATHAFFSGSGGGNGNFDGGAGGGALEISALGDIAIASALSANGGNGADGTLIGGAGGGGSGGGIYLASPGNVSLTGTLSAVGGAGGATASLSIGAGGNGGGGRVLVAAGSFSNGGTVAVNGAPAVFFGAGAGGAGTFASVSYASAVPEPATMALLLAAPLFAARRRATLSR